MRVRKRKMYDWYIESAQNNPVGWTDQLRDITNYRVASLLKNLYSLFYYLSTHLFYVF